MLDQVLDQLPTDGSEIDYEEFKNRVVNNVGYRHVQLIQQARRKKLASFRVEFDKDTGAMTGHFVKRVLSGGA